MKKKFLFCLFISIFSVWAEPSLQGYLENDLELQKLALEVQKAKLALHQNTIENGIDISLSTGKASFQFLENGTKISLKPNATLSIPQASNLSITGSSEISIDTTQSTIKDTSIGLSVDIISGSSITRKISKLKAKRTLLTAKRNLQNRALKAEKEYYTELKTLYNTAISIITTQNDLYDHKIAFQEIQAKGYSKTSSKYRQAEMKVLSDQHEVETKIRQLGHDCAVFATKCNTTFDTDQHPKTFLPSSIPQVEAINITDFAQTCYTKIEEATYDQTIAELERQANKNFTLSAGAGYTFNNSSAKSSTESLEDTVNITATTSLYGLNLTSGVSFPVTGDIYSPVYSLSASINPSTFLTTTITKKTNDLTRRQEQIAIVSAIDEYKTSVVDKQNELADILWSKETNTQTYDMYKTLADDMHKYLEAGIITESEYLSAFSNKESYRIKLLLDDINLIIYNNETKLLFYRDEEIQDN